MLRAFAVLAALMASLAASDRSFAAEHKLPAGYKLGRCVLEVQGKTYLSGRCAYLVDRDGSFEVIDPRKLWRDEGYFAYVNLDGASAEGSWNEETLSSHADAPLGPLTRRGACWVNKRARICLWRR